MKVSSAILRKLAEGPVDCVVKMNEMFLTSANNQLITLLRNLTKSDQPKKIVLARELDLQIIIELYKYDQFLKSVCLARRSSYNLSPDPIPVSLIPAGCQIIVINSGYVVTESASVDSIKYCDGIPHCRTEKKNVIRRVQTCC
jgi:hypothetical protein